MRLILGLDYPSAGSVTVNGRPYAQLVTPMHEAGVMLDAGAVHGGRTARNQLLGLAQTNGIGRRRVDEVLGLVGLAEVARKRSKGFSLGMRQRQRLGDQRYRFGWTLAGQWLRVIVRR
jgi:ABC-2 type transport system ATP-binding protein